ncbi:hypothetical protein [Cyclobacterium xiamenense]|uniref:hypothetical protein n=1 Tax=Cyclobacterium xiamenense TaxID=1297121 RepID=UPI0012B818FD|nr:hypothetical protein [Cyclobacterium xiamenense]
MAQLLNDIDDVTIDTVYLNKDINVMFDLSHLNEKGATLVAGCLGSSLISSEQPAMYVIHWRD